MLICFYRNSCIIMKVSNLPSFRVIQALIASQSSLRNKVLHVIFWEQVCYTVSQQVTQDNEDCYGVSCYEYAQTQQKNDLAAIVRTPRTEVCSANQQEFSNVMSMGYTGVFISLVTSCKLAVVFAISSHMKQYVHILLCR